MTTDALLMMGEALSVDILVDKVEGVEGPEPEMDEVVEALLRDERESPLTTTEVG